jgi:enoyl-CoA hydratase/carnithine racemase
MASDLYTALDEADRDRTVRSVIVTGAGRAFCAGADLADGSSTFRIEGNNPISDDAGRIALRLFEMRKPVIAAINGDAVGFGVTMTLPMDFRLATTSARFGFPFAKLGIVPEAASTWFLPRLVGMPTASRWMFSGTLIPAEEALRAGLVTSLHAPDDLVAAALDLARELTQSSSAVSVALTRFMLWQGLTEEHPRTAHAWEARGLALTGRSADAEEGVNAFLQKRPPVFTDQPTFATHEIRGR